MYVLTKFIAFCVNIYGYTAKRRLTNQNGYVKIILTY
jgi:hypothetical protein